MPPIKRDSKGQPYIEWHQANGCYKRAWIQQRTDPDKDWAGTGRYVNVARIESPGSGPAGLSADFPVFSKEMSDEEVLKKFVEAVCSATGCQI